MVSIRASLVVLAAKSFAATIFIFSWPQSSQYRYCSYQSGSRISCEAVGYDATCEQPPACGTFRGWYQPNAYVCKSEATSDCLCQNWFQSFFVIMSFQFAPFLLEMILYWRYGNEFDPRLEMVKIAESHSVTAKKMTTLLHPSLCLSSVFDVGSLALVPIAMSKRDVYCKSHPDREENVMLLFLGLLIIYSSNLIGACELWYQNRLRDSAVTLMRLDISVIYGLFVSMQAAVFPLSILSYVSSSRADERGEAERFTFTRYFYNGEHANDDSGAALSLVAVNRDWHGDINKVITDLFRRPTAVYSFLKLLMCVMLSAGIDNDYRYCGHTLSAWEQTCTGSGIDRCSAVCLTSPCHKDDGYYNRTCTSSQCMWIDRGFIYGHEVSMYCTASITAGGLCDNWMILKFSVIAMNVLHFAIQCAYYFKYENFDPQQNQIQIIQRYLFTGENLTHFLLHPAMCLISVLEAGSVMVAWLGVFFPPGIYCDIGQKSDTVYNAVVFAVMITAFEVYKANISSALRFFGEKKYSAMMLSFFRLDLFVFFGLTLFLQVFLFPFALYSHILGKWNSNGHRDDCSKPLYHGLDDDAIVGHLDDSLLLTVSEA